MRTLGDAWARVGVPAAAYAALLLIPLFMGLVWLSWAPSVWDVTTEVPTKALFTAGGFVLTVRHVHWKVLRRVRRAVPTVGRLVRTGGPAVWLSDAPAWAPEEKLAATAEHEAAHAVVAWALGGRVDSISLDARTGNGLTIWSPPGDWEPGRVAWAVLVTALAGNKIDLIAGRHCAGSYSDIQIAQQCAAMLISIGQAPAAGVELTTDGLLTAGREQADALLTDHARLVTQVADMLSRRHRYRPWRSPRLDSLTSASTR